MKSILVEGWRGTNQSLALVNQYQLIELLKHDGLALSHCDLPYPTPSWSAPDNGPGFSAHLAAQIASIPGPSSQPVDAVYRIAIPFSPSTAPASKSVTFIVSEFGLRTFQFSGRGPIIDQLCHDENLVVTPSNWSKMKLLEYGFPEEKLVVIPHGVNGDIYSPLSGIDKVKVRDDLGIAPEDFVFLNIGSLTLEKGLDVLVLAFSEIRLRYPNARLLLKDMRGLYGLELEGFLEHHVQNCGPLSAEVLNSIYRVEPSLSLNDMRLLYGAADVYVSPYRAEGFNLPVIEAIACGIPVIVSKGGATDDFCDSSTALLVSCDRVANADRSYFGGEQLAGYHLEPRVDSLVDQMETALNGNIASSEAFIEGRKTLMDRFSWKSAVDQLMGIL